MRYKRVINAAMLTALCAAVGFAFIYIPNIELITAAIFISGFLMGPAYGAAIGALAEFIFSLFNPYGASAPPLLLAQVISMSLVGFTGGIIRTRYWFECPRIRRHVITGLCGLLLTCVFDGLTTLSFAVFVAGGDTQKLASIFTSGIVFYLFHILINTLIFTTLVPVLLNRLHRYQHKGIQ
ncbi:MAG: ECF transporter S component [candidate division KSB1 bacterium]|nr:ECF transporter S component [candidate division KSB1 bacterium]